MIQNHLDHGTSKEPAESLSRVDSAVPLMRHDPSDVGSLILMRIISIHVVALRTMGPQWNSSVSTPFFFFTLDASYTRILEVETRCNRPFPSSLLPLFQNESKCETFHMKMSFTHKSIRMQIILIFI